MKVDVWSDVVCPWCFLGKRRLERALSSLGWADEVTVRWRAFQLDPSASSQPGDLRVAIERKYGPGAFDSMNRRLSALGSVEGITYRFDRAQRVNTFDAHRLLEWTWAESGSGVQDALKERLFRAYFEEGENVADHDALVRLAAEAGADEARARRVLVGDRFAAEVEADRAIAAERQFTGVPAFVIEDRMLIPGAQEVETMVAVLERARERLSAAGS